MSHHWKLALAVGVVMLVLTAIWVATMSLVPDNDVEAYKKSLIAKGEKLDISEVMPPPVPPGQNGADIVKQASASLLASPVYFAYSNNPPAMLIIAPGKAIVCFEQPDVRFEDVTNSWSNVVAAAEADRPATEQLRQALNFPSIDYNLDYTNWQNLGNLYSSIVRSSRRLSAEATCNLHQGDMASAATNIYVLLALAAEERDGTPPIYRDIQAQTAADANWELLQSTNVNDAELAMLQKGWERLEFIHATEHWVIIERAFYESEIQKVRTSNEELNRYVSFHGSRDIWTNMKQAVVRAAWRESWSYSDELRMLQNGQIVLDAIRIVETNGYFDPTYTNMMNELNLANTNEPENFVTRWDRFDLHRLFSARGEAMGRLFASTMRIEVTREIVITAIALKRYQLKHGNYPPTLSGLVPEFLSSVPLDPIDGKPLRYRLNADGTFLLYSVGENGKDDSGDPSSGKYVAQPPYWTDIDALDWVWPQPATPTEIEYFYTHPPM